MQCISFVMDEFVHLIRNISSVSQTVLEIIDAIMTKGIRCFVTRKFFIFHSTPLAFNGYLFSDTRITGEN